jgi:general stress protein 26
MLQSLPEPLTGLLRGASLCFISTVMPDGSPQLTQTWAGTDGTHILINTAEGFQKVSNIRRDPRVAVAIADPGKQPFPWPNGRDETRLILTINAHKIYTPMG